MNGIFDYSSLKFFCLDAEGLFKSNKERGKKKMIFGSLKEWKRFNKGIIDKKEFNRIKNSKPLLFVGFALLYIPAS